MIIGNHLWETCGDCGRLVKLTGWLRGLHLCLTPEEIALKQSREDRGRIQRDQLQANRLWQSMKGRATD